MHIRVCFKQQTVVARIAMIYWEDLGSIVAALKPCIDTLRVERLLQQVGLPLELLQLEYSMQCLQPTQ